MRRPSKSNTIASVHTVLSKQAMWGPLTVRRTVYPVDVVSVVVDWVVGLDVTAGDARHSGLLQGPPRGDVVGVYRHDHTFGGDVVGPEVFEGRADHRGAEAAPDVGGGADQ